MSFHVPEQHRFNQQMANAMPQYPREAIETMVLDKSVGNNGYFFLPRLGKKAGYYYLCKAAEVQDWNCVAVFIPSASGAPPSWEEIAYLRKFFWGEEDTVTLYMTKDVYLDQRGWLHLWQPKDPQASCYPPLKETIHFDPPFWKQLIGKIKRKIYGHRRK